MAIHKLSKIFNVIFLLSLACFGDVYAAGASSHSSDPVMSVMYAARFNPTTGWGAGAPIPGLDNPAGGISWIASSGGSTAWAFGTDVNYQWYMAVSTGGAWQSFLTPKGFGNEQNGFLAAYPETGANSNGWLFSSNQVVYFDGKSFGTPDTTTFSAYNCIRFYSSSGTGWVLASNNAQDQGKVFVSTFINSANALSGDWSTPVALPFTSVLTQATPDYAEAAANNKLYVLGMQNSNVALVSVDQTNKVTVLNNNFNVPNLPNNGGFVAAQGNHIVVMLFSEKALAPVVDYSYYSPDGGVHWKDLSAQMPQNLAVGIAAANGVVAMPPSSVTPGGFIDLKQANPQWLPYPVTPLSDERNVASLSADGTQQCSWDETHVSCFNFNTQQWLTSALPSGELIMWPTVPASLGNNEVAVIDQNNNGLFYDGSGWHIQSIAPINCEPNLSTPLIPFAYSPNSLWVFGFSVPPNRC